MLLPTKRASVINVGTDGVGGGVGSGPSSPNRSLTTGTVEAEETEEEKQIRNLVEGLEKLDESFGYGGHIG